jgi:hypothetical protein
MRDILLRFSPEMTQSNDSWVSRTFSGSIWAPLYALLTAHLGEVRQVPNVGNFEVSLNFEVSPNISSDINIMFPKG